jgi:hypothetical protein
MTQLFSKAEASNYEAAFLYGDNPKQALEVEAAEYKRKYKQQQKEQQFVDSAYEEIIYDDNMASNFSTTLEDREVNNSSAMQYLNEYKAQQVIEEVDEEVEIPDSITGKIIRAPEINSFVQTEEKLQKVQTLQTTQIKPIEASLDSTSTWEDIQKFVGGAYKSIKSIDQSDIDDTLSGVKNVLLGGADMIPTTLQKTIDFSKDIANYTVKTLLVKHFYPGKDVSELPDVFTPGDWKFEALQTNFPLKGSEKYEKSSPQLKAYYDEVNASPAFHLSREISSYLAGYGFFKKFVKSQMKKQVVKPNTTIAAFAASSKNLFMTEVLPSAFAAANIDPTMGNLSIVMKQMKWVDEDNSLTNFFDVGITEDSQSEKRLEQRFKTGLEDGILTVGIVALIKGISKSPEAAKWFKEALKDSDPNLVPNVMEKLGLPNPKKDIVAYHGSLHKFDKFDHSKIGSGEGGQAYGWGTYLSEHPNVAGGYQKRLSGNDKLDKLTSNGKPIPFSSKGETSETAFIVLLKNEGDVQKALKELDGRASNSPLKVIRDNSKKSSDFLADYASKNDLKFDKKGSFYEVDLPDEYIDDMIDYDLDIASQSEKVRATLLSLRKEFGTSFNDGQGAYDAIVFEMRMQGHKNPEKAASEFLDKKGIKGIKFLDQDSRNANYTITPPDETIAGDWMVKDNMKPNSVGKHFDNEAGAQKFLDDKNKKTRNFVVFNEGSTKVLKRNDKVIAKDLVNRTLFHTSSKEFDIMNTNKPAWFAVKESHAAEGWGKNITSEGGLPYIYKADFKGNLIKRKEAQILFKKNNIDFDDYEASLTENPTSKKVLNMKGTQLLKREGFDGLEYLDYDPRNFQKDLKAIIVFEPSKSISSSKRIKAK